MAATTDVIGKVDRVSVALFSHHLGALDFEGAWHRAGIEFPIEVSEKREKPQLMKRAQGTVEPYSFTYMTVGDRIGITVSPSPASIAEAGQSVRLNSLSDHKMALEWLTSQVSKLMNNALPPIYRIGVHSVVQWDFDTREVAEGYVRARVPLAIREPYSSEVSFSEDFIIQFNRRTNSPIGAINRLVNWQTSRVAAVVLSLQDGNQEARNNTFWVLQKTIDVNNAIDDSRRDLAPPEAQALLSETAGHNAQLIEDALKPQ